MQIPTDSRRHLYAIQQACAAAGTDYCTYIWALRTVGQPEKKPAGEWPFRRADRSNVTPMRRKKPL